MAEDFKRVLVFTGNQTASLVVVFVCLWFFLIIFKEFFMHQAYGDQIYIVQPFLLRVGGKYRRWIGREGRGALCAL